jgi:hypothetical protein
MLLNEMVYTSETVTQVDGWIGLLPCLNELINHTILGSELNE